MRDPYWFVAKLLSEFSISGIELVQVDRSTSAILVGELDRSVTLAEFALSDFVVHRGGHYEEMFVLSTINVNNSLPLPVADDPLD